MQPFILGPADKEHFVYASRQTETVIYNSSAKVLDNGRVFLSNSYKVKDIKTYVSSPGSNPGRSGYFTYKQSYHPFEPVTVVYGDKETPFYLEAGQEVVVPAIVAVAYQRTLIEGKSDEKLRELGNYAMIAGGLAAAPFTGGSSLAGVASVIAVGGSVVGSIDFIVQNNKDIDKNSELYKSWDQFYMAYGMIDAGAGGATLGLASYRALRNIKLVESYNKFNAALKVSKADIKLALNDDFTTLRQILGGGINNAGGDLATQFFNKFGKALPKNWEKFNPNNHIEFAERLKKFRGNDDLTFDTNFRGGEGQLFDSPLSDDTVLKRWFGSRVKDFPESIRLLKEAENLVKTNSELGKLIDVVSVSEKGSDWVIRGFKRRSIPLKNAVSDPLVAKTRQETIDILSKQSGEISANILKKLNKNSANVHWSPEDQKLFIIDMQ